MGSPREASSPLLITADETLRLINASLSLVLFISRGAHELERTYSVGTMAVNGDGSGGKGSF